MLDITPLLTQWGYPLLALLLAGFSMWLMAKSGAWLSAHAGFLNAQTQQKLIALENEALDTVSGAILAKAQAAGAADGKIKLNNALVAWGAQIVVNHAGGILASNGLNPEDAAAKLLSRLPPVETTQDTTGVTIKTTTVTTEPLPPIGDTK